MVEDISVTSFRNYLRINTIHPEPDYNEAVEFLHNLATEVGLDSKTVLVAPQNPVVIISWAGKNLKLPSICLNSHMDVVPVFREKWTYDPFSAYKDEQGNIYARGAQDMKCVGIQYIEAIRRLKSQKFQPFRSIHVTFVPDEEVGGAKGMALFVHTEEFKHLNIGFGLDEGIANPNPEYLIYYAERVKWWMKVTCPGNVGHGSLFMENTAAEKFQKVVDTFLTYREAERQKLINDKSLDIADVTTVNLTMISGGVQVNVLPSELVANFDIRVTPKYDQKELRRQFETMAKECGKGITVEFLQHYENDFMTSTDASDPWWSAFSGVLHSMKLPYVKKIFPAATDARYLRPLGIPVLGFSPMVNTPTLLHEHDEYLNENVFLKGVDIYTRLIQALANVA